VSPFVSGDDIKAFEGWLTGVQGIDPATITPDALASWRELYDEIGKNPTPKVGEMKLRALKPGEHRYAVAVRDSGLWLTLWVRRSPKGEFFVMVPRADRGWDPHTSYHVDGTFHAKSHGRKFGQPQKRQSLTGTFRGTEHLGAYAGHGPKTVGAICDPAAFSGVVEVPIGILGPRDGCVLVDLVEPGCEPISWPLSEAVRRTFKDTSPWLVIRVGSQAGAANQVSPDRVD